MSLKKMFTKKIKNEIENQKVVFKIRNNFKDDIPAPKNRINEELFNNVMKARGGIQVLSTQGENCNN